MSSPTSSEEHEEVEAPEETQDSTSRDDENNEKKKNDADDSGSDSKDEDSGEVGLLDRPVEVTGSRERKKVQRLEISFKVSQDKLEVPKGSGDKLGDCPMIEQKLQKNAVKELKVLHKILFGRAGSGNEIKKNIRKFSGFTFDKDSADYEKKKASLDKINLVDLKHVCGILDLERGGTKEEVVNRILEFALLPKISDKKVVIKRSAKGTKRKRKEKKNASTSSKQRKPNTSDEDEGSSDKAESDDETSDKEKKKKQVSKKKNQSKAKKVSAVKKATSKKKVSSDDSDDDDDDDTPLVKIAKSPPTDAEIKALIKKILQSADLEEITMKKVIKQVFDGYPDFDLSDKKDYIKATVKSVIS